MVRWCWISWIRTHNDAPHRPQLTHRWSSVATCLTPERSHRTGARCRSTGAVGCPATGDPTATPIDEIAERLFGGLSTEILREPRERFAEYERTTRVRPSLFPERLGNAVGFLDIRQQKTRGDHVVARPRALLILHGCLVLRLRSLLLSQESWRHHVGASDSSESTEGADTTPFFTARCGVPSIHRA